MRPTWEQYALNLAEAAASRSEDPLYAVGAVVLRTNLSVAAVGYNGVAAGLDIDWEDRDLKTKFVVHAEQNALRWCRPDDTVDGWLATTHYPCATCLRMAGSYDIARILWRHDLDWGRYDRAEIEEIASALDITLVHVP